MIRKDGFKYIGSDGLERVRINLRINDKTNHGWYMKIKTPEAAALTITEDYQLYSYITSQGTFKNLCNDSGAYLYQNKDISLSTIVLRGEIKDRRRIIPTPDNNPEHIASLQRLMNDGEECLLLVESLMDTMTHDPRMREALKCLPMPIRDAIWHYYTCI